MKLKTGTVNRKAKPVVIDGGTFHIRPLNGELYTSFSMYMQEMVDSTMADRDKRTFIKNHLVDWEGIIVTDNKDKEKEIPFTMTAALELLLDPDADDVMTILFSESLGMRTDIDKAKAEDEEKAKKS